jgi:hypothetical protein
VAGSDHAAYAEAIREACGLATDKRLRRLNLLPGAGVVMASAILHFLFPSEHPIVDRRAIATLRRLDVRGVSANSERGYSRCTWSRPPPPSTESASARWRWRSTPTTSPTGGGETLMSIHADT